MTAIDFSPRRVSRSSFPIAALLVAFSVPAAATPFAGVSLRVSNEEAPPGGSFQLKVLVTEPTPIVTGSAALGVGGLLLQGVVFPDNPDAAGAAVFSKTGVTLRAVSPSGTLGLSLQAPIVAVTLAIPQTAPFGSAYPLTIDPLLSTFIDPAGQPYPEQIKPGKLRIAPILCISDVVPGGGFLPAGTTIVVVGLGFQPGAIVEVDGVPITSTVFVDASHLEATLGADAQLDGRRVRVRNPDTTRAGYYSYLRAASVGSSARPLLGATEPVFPVQPLSNAIFAAPALDPATFFGLALQNPQAVSSAVEVELHGQAGEIIASTSLVLPPRSEMIREISELLTGVAAPAGSTVTVTSVPPIQMLGLRGDESAAAVDPILPALSSP